MGKWNVDVEFLPGDTSYDISTTSYAISIEKHIEGCYIIVKRKSLRAKGGKETVTFADIHYRKIGGEGR